MSQSIYSYNGSKLRLRMEDYVAEAYNRAIDAWYQAQRDLKKKLGRDLEAADIMNLQVTMTDTEHKAWNAVSDTVNDLLAKGLILYAKDCPSDRLVKLQD